ncbi:TMEM175 family protein [Deinococcus altitudinis]|uniref:TMEM175 family protein n=1 Tax=Deinococcus altitudinis TaxID=468914 RepID=UPI003891E04B
MTERSGRFRVLPGAGLPNAERLKFFTDAVVAIALTLLILPLLESVSDAATHHLNTAQVLREHSAQLFSFALSFAVVANFWNVHHRVFEHVEHVTSALNVLNFAWMFNIVLLQFSTALVGSQPTSQLLLLYVGPMALCGLLMSAITLLITRSEAVRGSLPTFPPARVAASLVSSGLFVGVLLLVLVLPGVGFYSLLLMFLSAPLQRLIAGRLRHPAH